VPHTVNSQEPLALAQAALAQRTTLRRRLIAELRNEANFSRNPNKMKPLASLRRPRRTHLPPKPPLPRRTALNLRPTAELRNEPNSRGTPTERNHLHPSENGNGPTSPENPAPATDRTQAETNSRITKRTQFVAEPQQNETTCDPPETETQPLLPEHHAPASDRRSAWDRQACPLFGPGRETHHLRNSAGWNQDQAGLHSVSIVRYLIGMPRVDRPRRSTCGFAFWWCRRLRNQPSVNFVS
jgi:hypothetical protein